ncbi:MAG: hypothetical protein JW701_00710 [Kosmotogaceae bacterium]|nr:hypothetical protein [Kosmotogaceae bacterium]
MGDEFIEKNEADKADNESLSKKLHSLENKVDALRFIIDKMKKEFVAQNYKSSPSDNKRLEEIESQLKNIREDVNSTADGQLLEELKEYKRELDVSNAQIHTLERVMNQMREEIERLEKTAEKFSDMGQLGTLKDEIEHKVDSLQEVEQDVQSLSTQIANFYKDINSKIAALHSQKTSQSAAAEGKTKEMQADIQNMKSSLKDYVKKEELLAILDDRLSNQKRSDISPEMLDDLKEIVDMTIDEKIGQKIDTITNMGREISYRFDEINKLEDKFESTQKELKNLPKEVSRIKKELVELRQHIIDITPDPEHDSISKQLADSLEDISIRTKKIEDFMMRMDIQLQDVSERIKRDPELDIDASMKELLDKTIFLETRLSAIESSFNEKSPRPVILE